MKASSFADRLQSLINGRAVNKVALEWGVPNSTLQSYLARGSQPSIAQVRKIAAAAKVREEWLFTGQGERDWGAFEERLAQLRSATAFAKEHGGGVVARERAIQEQALDALALEASARAADERQTVERRKFRQRLGLSAWAQDWVVDAFERNKLSVDENASFYQTLVMLLAREDMTPNALADLTQWYAFEQKARALAIMTHGAGDTSSHDVGER